MNTKQLLEQILQSGNDFLKAGNKQDANTASGSAGLGDLLSGNSGSLLAGSVLGLLLGSKKGRKMGGKLLKYGSLAALGTMAYQAYSRSKVGDSVESAADGNDLGSQAFSGEVNGSDEQRSMSVLKAMIAAAKADGHIDDNERALIEQGAAGLTNDIETQQWLRAELSKPVDAVEVAQSAASPSNAAEMYLASVLVIDDQNAMERAYLDQLASALNIDGVLKADLEAQVRS